jgi:hypothetical protein
MSDPITVLGGIALFCFAALVLAYAVEVTIENYHE